MRVLRFLLAALITMALLLAGFVTLGVVALAGLALLVGQRFRCKTAVRGARISSPARMDSTADVIDIVATDPGERR